VRRTGQALLTKTIFALVRRAVAPIVGRPVAPHMLRHSFASHLRENGADLQLIQEALGHANINTTTMYAHISTNKRRQDLARLLAE
jgi:site-specific recombinase XerD